MPGTDLAGTRVLLVEDETLIALLLEDALAELGCEVVGPVAQVDAARRAIESERFDCALVDIDLRGRPAYALAELLEARGIPFGFVTGYEASHIDPQFGQRPVLTKPFDIRQLRTLLVDMSRRGRRRTRRR